MRFLAWVCTVFVILCLLGMVGCTLVLIWGGHDGRWASTSFLLFLCLLPPGAAAFIIFTRLHDQRNKR